MTNDQAVAEFVRLLNVEPAGLDRFVGATEQEEHWPRVFGGLVLGQAALAAGRTAPDPTLHSLHAYFLRGGRPGVPIEYTVERVRDGRTFTARRVLARQGGDAICDIMLSYVHPEEGVEHQDPMPAAPDPELLRDSWEIWRGEDGNPLWPKGPIEWRYDEPPDYVAKPGESTTELTWMRMRAPLPEDAMIHAAALAFLSDEGSLGGVERRHGWDGFSHHASASLDHAFWLHRPARWDGWLLMVTDSPVAYAARAHTIRQFFTRDGIHVATMAQEAVVRRDRPPVVDPM
jgi:acyl-CoA thioesterase-2